MQRSPSLRMRTTGGRGEQPVKLRDLFWLYLKARILSWLTSSQQFAHVYTTNLMRINLAQFVNGKMIVSDEGQNVPDIVPPEWNTPPADPGTSD
jgi:hypothetical protein